MTISFKSSGQERLFRAVMSGLGRLGYSGELLATEYDFNDWFSASDETRRIDAAAFGQTPVSYETALFGIALVTGNSGKSLVAQHRSLGAPVLFEIDDDSISEWTVGKDHETTVLQHRFGFPDVDLHFTARAHQWSPAEFLRVKTTGKERWEYQHSLFAGLIPELEAQIQSRLHPRLTAAVSSAQKEYSKWTGGSLAEERELFATIFRLLTGKVFCDRGHRDFRDLKFSDGPDEVLLRVAAHYKEEPAYPLNEPARHAAFRHIWNRMDFRNLSIDVLSQIWSSTLVSPKTRKRLGIYRTRKSIVRYILDRIPFTDFLPEERFVLEPCFGSATFLVAAMEKLRELRTDLIDPEEQHAYFRDMLVGYERDSFGYEIGHLCLSLSDYPNHDGWRLSRENVFTSNSFQKSLSESRIVLCNPPFKRFDRDEKRSNHADLWEPPAELLDRVLRHLHPEGVLGFVLPRTFINGDFYRTVREKLVRRFSEIEIVQLADKGWEHADPETAILIATKPNRAGRASVSFGIVRKAGWRDFDWFHKINIRDRDDKGPDEASDSIAVPQLREIWEYLEYCPKLGDMATGHHGLRWNLDLKNHSDILVRDDSFQESRLGIRPQPEEYYSFQCPKLAYLSFAPERRKYSAFDLPWNEPKVIVNKIAKERGPWRFAAFADLRGLACSETFYPIWPHDPANTISLAAVLNGPVANAFAQTHSGKRETTLRTIHAIPFPMLNDRQKREIARLVAEYLNHAESAEYEQARNMLLKIDAAVLEAYDLPARLERQLLDNFNSEYRQVPFAFGDYFPTEFEPNFKLSEWLTGRPQMATVGRFRSQPRDLPGHRIRGGMRCNSPELNGIESNQRIFFTCHLVWQGPSRKKTMAGTILVIQHIACETLGTIESALRAHGLSHRYVRVHQGEAVPAELGDAAGLIVMGGPMSVYDHGRLPHLVQEMRLVESALKSERPVLGVCLGSQVLAHVLGAKVYPGRQKEIGWHSVTVSLAAKQDAMWAAVPDSFVGFHWHGDVFDLPAGATQIASSELTANQAFRFGRSAYGILFHLEVTASQVDVMAAEFPDELQQSGGNPKELQQGTAKHLSQLTAIGQDVFGGWSQLAAKTI